MNFIKKYCEDFFILAGAAVIVYATFRIYATAGFFVLGAALLAIGIALAKNPPKVK
jgi:hypothetical protein